MKKLNVVVAGLSALMLQAATGCQQASAQTKGPPAGSTPGAMPAPSKPSSSPGQNTKRDPGNKSNGPQPRRGQTASASARPAANRGLRSETLIKC